MDKKKSILNVSVSVGFKLIIIVLAIAAKRVLIQTCGNEVNGLNALYLSIIGFLSVVELGVGTAINFCMYKPIVEGNTDKVSALYHLFHKLYCSVGAFILVGGLAITPFIHHFAKDYVQLDVNMYRTFVLMVISVAMTYVFGAKVSLINAYKDNYITAAIGSVGTILLYGMQVLALWLTKSFEAYLFCRILFALSQWAAVEWIARKKHSDIIRNKQKLDKDTQKELGRNVKAMFMHKIGTLLVNTVDSLVISAFVGVVALGEYSNYTMIMTSMDGLIVLVFSSLTSVFGHLYAEKTKQTTMAYFEGFHLVNFVVGTVFYLGYYAIIDNLIAILFAQSLIAEKSVSFVITLNGFVQFMRQNSLVFRDATGTFYNDRWKPLAEGCVNIVLSILFVKLIGVTGVIAATVLTNLLICHIIEPYVLYKNAFEVSPKRYYLRNYAMIAAFMVALLILNGCMQHFETQWMELLVNGCISVGISFVVCVLLLIVRRDARNFVKEKLLRR